MSFSNHIPPFTSLPPPPTHTHTHTHTLYSTPLLPHMSSSLANHSDSQSAEVCCLVYRTENDSPSPLPPIPDPSCARYPQPQHLIHEPPLPPPREAYLPSLFPHTHLAFSTHITYPTHHPNPPPHSPLPSLLLRGTAATAAPTTSGCSGLSHTPTRLIYCCLPLSSRLQFFFWYVVAFFGLFAAIKKCNTTIHVRCRPPPPIYTIPLHTTHTHTHTRTHLSPRFFLCFVSPHSLLCRRGKGGKSGRAAGSGGEWWQGGGGRNIECLAAAQSEAGRPPRGPNENASCRLPPAPAAPTPKKTTRRTPRPAWAPGWRGSAR